MSLKKILKNPLINIAELATAVYPNSDRLQAGKNFRSRKSFNSGEMQAIRAKLSELKNQIEEL